MPTRAQIIIWRWAKQQLIRICLATLTMSLRSPSCMMIDDRGRKATCIGHTTPDLTTLAANARKSCNPTPHSRTQRPKEAHWTLTVSPRAASKKEGQRATRQLLLGSHSAGPGRREWAHLGASEPVGLVPRVAVVPHPLLFSFLSSWLARGCSSRFYPVTDSSSMCV